MERRIERTKQVCARVGNISRATLYRWMADRDFPHPVRLTQRCTGWDSAEVDRWIAQRIAEARR